MANFRKVNQDKTRGVRGVKLRCKFCGNEFFVQPNLKHSLFCSRACASAHRRFNFKDTEFPTNKEFNKVLEKHNKSIRDAVNIILSRYADLTDRKDATAYVQYQIADFMRRYPNEEVSRKIILFSVRHFISYYYMFGLPRTPVERRLSIADAEELLPKFAGINSDVRARVGFSSLCDSINALNFRGVKLFLKYVSGESVDDIKKEYGYKKGQNIYQLIYLGANLAKRAFTEREFELLTE